MQEQKQQRGQELTTSPRASQIVSTLQMGE